MKYRIECSQCGGEGYTDGDCVCGDDCCCCAEPEPPMCRACRGCGYQIVSELTDENYTTAVPIPEETP